MRGTVELSIEELWNFILNVSQRTKEELIPIFTSLFKQYEYLNPLCDIEPEDYYLEKLETQFGICLINPEFKLVYHGTGLFEP